MSIDLFLEKVLAYFTNHVVSSERKLNLSNIFLLENTTLHKSTINNRF